jgi:H+/Cl- antiporter ClcA
MKPPRLVWALWPSFLVSIPAVGLLFSFVHPEDVVFFGQHPHIDAEGIYTLGFLLIWLFCSASSMLTMYIFPTKADVND